MRLGKVIASLTLCVAFALAQPAPGPQIQYRTSSPAGQPCGGTNIALLTTTGVIFTCVSGVYTAATSPGGGAFPVGGAGALQVYASSSALTGDSTKLFADFTGGLFTIADLQPWFSGSNSTRGADPNFRTFSNWKYYTNSSQVNPNFTIDDNHYIETNFFQGQNNANATSKSSVIGIQASVYAWGQGQRFVQGNTMFAYGMGDAFISSDTMNIAGGSNASGDEGQAYRTMNLNQQGGLSKGTLGTVPTQTSCNTTLTQNVTKNIAAQTVTVASSAGCLGWVVVNPSNFVASAPNMQPVKVTAIAAGSITGVFKENASSGDPVKPAVKLPLNTAGGFGSDFGQGRYLVNLTSAAYTTGTIASISGTGFVGSGTAWASNMVGGSTLIPGCAAVTNDDYSGAPFAGGSGPLKGWFGISSVTDATHLNIAHANGATLTASYSGKGVGAGGYTIRACARILTFDDGTETSRGDTLILEPNSFTWTTGDSVEAALSVDAVVNGLIMRAAWYNPNATLGTFYTAWNIGQAPFDSGFNCTQNLADNTVKGFTRCFVTGPDSIIDEPIHLTGKSPLGHGIRMQTYTGGDNKRILWDTSNVPATIEGDYTTAQLWFKGGDSNSYAKQNYSAYTADRTIAWPDWSGAVGLRVAAPSTASDACTTNQFAFDTGFIYVCTATNTWKRVAIATW